QALLALKLFVFDRLPVLKRPKAVADDAGEMDEYVLALRTDDEPEALFRIEPLDGAVGHGRPPAAKDSPGAGRSAIRADRPPAPVALSHQSPSHAHSLARAPAMRFAMPRS